MQKLLVEFIQSQKELNQAENLIFYGGSFNPWHPGHSACLELINKDFPIIVIPDHNPHKELNINRETDLKKIKTELNKIAKKTFFFPDFYLQKQQNPSIKWISLLSKEFSEKKFHLLIGHDSFQNILSWTDADKLLKLLESLMIVSRSEDPLVSNKIKNEIISKFPKLTLNFLGHHSFEGVSSSEIRRLK